MQHLLLPIEFSVNEVNRDENALLQTYDRKSSMVLIRKRDFPLKLSLMRFFFRIFFRDNSFFYEVPKKKRAVNALRIDDEISCFIFHRQRQPMKRQTFYWVES